MERDPLHHLVRRRLADPQDPRDVLLVEQPLGLLLLNLLGLRFAHAELVQLRSLPRPNARENVGAASELHALDDAREPVVTNTSEVHDGALQLRSGSASATHLHARSTQATQRGPDPLRPRESRGPDHQLGDSL